MTLEERVAELETSLLRTQAKSTAQTFVFNFALSAMLKEHPDVGRALANLAKGTFTPGPLPSSFAARPEFAQVMVEHIRTSIEILIDPYHGG